MLERIASALGRNDELPNIELAEQLVHTQNQAGIDEIVFGLEMDSATANDCIKVLYEIGKRKRELIAPYAGAFIGLLRSRNNRLVWGAMTALGQIADLNPELVFAHLDEVQAAYEGGSVITIDHAISVFALLCNANKRYAQRILPILLGHLAHCRAKEIPQHLERMAICFHTDNASQFRSAIGERYGELSKPQRARADKVLKTLSAVG